MIPESRHNRVHCLLVFFQQQTELPVLVQQRLVLNQSLRVRLLELGLKYL